MSDDPGAAFSGGYMYWVGMNTTTDDPDELATYHDFYWVHLGEVVDKNPNFLSGHRYELVEQDPHWPIGARWLAVYDIADEEGAQGYLDRHDGLRGGRFRDFTPTPEVWNNSTEWVWQLMWRRLDESGPPGATADLIVLETGGADKEAPPKDGAARTTRHRLMRAIRHPEPECPPTLDVIELDASAPTPASAQTAGAPHDSWRFVYRRLTP